ncbi:MAG: glycogen-binding domain-containing protein [Gemmatimonadota bacterium]|nr:glycogen-binding domain-containing protein [Gemmatimonadota bacterium]
MMRRHVAAAMCLVLPLAFCRAVAAQRTALLDAGFGSVHYESYLPSTVLTLGPAFSARAPFAEVTGSGTFSHFESGRWSAQSTLNGSVYTPSIGMVRGELAGLADLNVLSDITRAGEALAFARAHLVDQRQGAWAGGGAGRVWWDGIWQTVARSEAGAWARVDSLRLSASVTRTDFVGTIAPAFLGYPPESRGPYTDAVTALHLTRGVVELDGSFGRRFSRPEEETSTWHVSGTLWMSSQLALIASAGRYAADIPQSIPGAQFVTVALRMRTRPPALAASLAVALATGFEVRGGADSPRLIRVRAHGARRVELMGDFTDWLPVDLTSTVEDEWEVLLPISAGTHRVNLRIDGGAWVVPPGVTAITDDFNGIVGLLVIIG